MRRILRTVVLSLALLAAVAGAQEPSKKDRLRWIREQYQAVEAGAGKSRPVNRNLNEFDHYLCYSEGRSVRKIELYVIPERTSFYFEKGKLFFVFRENGWNLAALKDAGDKIPRPLREERIYVEGDRIIEALLRETDGETFEGVPNRPHERILGFTPDEAASFLQDAYDALTACRSPG